MRNKTYTGYTDSEDTKIYEGDKIYSSFGIPPRKVTAEVFYDGQMCMFMVNTDATPQTITLKEFIKLLGTVYHEQ